MRVVNCCILFGLFFVVLLTTCDIKTEPNEVLIPKDFLVNQSELSGSSYIFSGGDFGHEVGTIFNVYSNIIVDSLFTLDSGAIIGFDFQIESSILGLQR